MKKRFLLLLPLLLASCSNEDICVYNEPFEEYYAGYSSKEIEIPEGETLYIAGYHQAEEIQGVLDKQKACALTINDAIFISIDSVGISNYFVKQIRELCNKNNLLMICDEVQCGMGRTGKMFAWQHYGIKEQPRLMPWRPSQSVTTGYLTASWPGMT